jgi:hypothetical protein
VRVSEQQILEAVHEYCQIFLGPLGIRAMRVRAGPVNLGQGRTAWLVTVEADGARLLVTTVVLETGSPVFGHLRIAP